MKYVESADKACYCQEVVSEKVDKLMFLQASLFSPSASGIV